MDNYDVARGNDFYSFSQEKPQLSTVNCQLSIKKAAARFCGSFLTQLLLSVNGALTTILALALETDSAVNQSEQGVVAADTDIDTGMDVGASLANQNVAGQNELTVSALDAQALCLGVTAVLGGTAALMVREVLNTNLQHGITPPKLQYNQDSLPAGKAA